MKSLFILALLVLLSSGMEQSDNAPFQAANARFNKQKRGHVDQIVAQLGFNYQKPSNRYLGRQHRPIGKAKQRKVMGFVSRFFNDGWLRR